MITLFLLGLVGVGALGATYAIGPLQKALPPEAFAATPWAIAAAGIAAVLLAPAWLGMLGVGVAIAGFHQAAFGTRWVVPERPSPAAIPADADVRPGPKTPKAPPDKPATLPRPPGYAPAGRYDQAPSLQGERAGSILDFARDAAVEYLTTSGGAVPDRFMSAWRTAVAQWPSSHPIPEVVTSQMASNPDGPLYEIDLKLPPRLKWDGRLVESWIDRSNRAVGRAKLQVYPLHPLGDDVYRFTVATAT